MRLWLAFLCSMFALLLTSPAKTGASRALRLPAAADEGVACRALEAHTDAASSLTVVVFHHSDEFSRAPLAALLHEHSEAAVDVKIEGGAEQSWRGTVFRLKSCFGRGLLLLPAAAPIKDGTVFRLRLSAP